MILTYRKAAEATSLLKRMRRKSQTDGGSRITFESSTAAKSGSPCATVEEALGLARRLEEHGPDFQKARSDLVRIWLTFVL